MKRAFTIADLAGTKAGEVKDFPECFFQFVSMNEQADPYWIVLGSGVAAIRALQFGEKWLESYIGLGVAGVDKKAASMRERMKNVSRTRYADLLGDGINTPSLANGYVSLKWWKGKDGNIHHGLAGFKLLGTPADMKPNPRDFSYAWWNTSGMKLWKVSKPLAQVGGGAFSNMLRAETPLPAKYEPIERILTPATPYLGQRVLLSQEIEGVEVFTFTQELLLV